MSANHTQLAIIGTGYVGLVTGTCFADSGNDVTCLDINQMRIEQLNRGEMPFYEPHLPELVQKNRAAGRLHFTTDVAAAVSQATLIFLCVGTPGGADGSADLTALWSAVDAIAPHLRPDALVVTKSTVPVGTSAKVFNRLKELTGREVDVASNPEFLVEGSAISTFQKPDHVVVGVRRKEVSDQLHQLYKPYLRRGAPFQVMSPESAEQVKLSKNAFLLIKVAFINETANDCEQNDADIDDVRRAIGSDSRIGSAFLHPGVGAGGSCLEKDASAQVSSAKNRGVELLIVQASLEANKRQKRRMLQKISNHFAGDLRDKNIAVCGLAFKPGTDDIREAPALVLLDGLLEQGVNVRVHDPAAMANVRTRYGERLMYCDSAMDALDGADALVIMTEWSEYHRPSFAEMRKRLRRPIVFDGRNVYDPSIMRRHGFTYYSFGRPPVVGERESR